MPRTKQVHDDLSRRTYSSTEMAQLAQVTLRQLQWWDERKVVTPRHENHKRVYELREAAESMLVAELRRKGLPLQRIRRLLRLFRQETRRRPEELLSPDSECYLLTDGKSVQLEDRRERMIDLLKSARKPMFLVSLSDQVRRLQGTPRRTPAGEASPGMRVRAAV
jgi:DNA-binding transcriptional MerR regulator